MPKRPCAIVITNDDSTIISADKFGDVYSLPLLPLQVPEVSKTTAQQLEPPSSKPFTPAANEFTIHSQRNRKALENQKRQIIKLPEKSQPAFEHKLLLGHVSLLTDVALVTSEGRDYIITADRDEHIRVSRGIPQTHVIEGFCLGHTEFITRLCIPNDRPELLISGGGDDELFIWDWKSGQVLSKTDVRNHFDPMRQEMDIEIARRYAEKKKSETHRGTETLGANGAKVAASKQNEDLDEETPTGTSKPAVSGIYETKQMLDGEYQDTVIVTCEGFVYHPFCLVKKTNLYQHSCSVHIQFHSHKPPRV